MTLDIFLTVVSFVLVGMLTVFYGSNVGGEYLRIAAGLLGAVCVVVAFLVAVLALVL